MTTSSFLHVSLCYQKALIKSLTWYRLLGAWAPLLTLVCTGFPCLASYHQSGAISRTDTWIDEGTSKWALWRWWFHCVCWFSLGRDCWRWRRCWWGGCILTPSVWICTNWIHCRHRSWRDWMFRKWWRSTRRGRWCWRRVLCCDSRSAGWFYCGVEAIIAPFLELRCWQLAEASRIRFEGCHQHGDLVPRGDVAGAAELLQWPALENDVVLLCDEVVKITVVHARHWNPSSLTW